jgi:hypothetical protein
MQGLGGRAGFKQVEQTLAGGPAQAAQLRQDGPMDADDAVSLLPLVEDGDVGEADEGPSWAAGGPQFLQKSQGSIAAAGAEDGSYGRV